MSNAAKQQEIPLDEFDVIEVDDYNVAAESKNILGNRRDKSDSSTAKVDAHTEDYDLSMPNVTTVVANSNTAATNGDFAAANNPTTDNAIAATNNDPTTANTTANHNATVSALSCSIAIWFGVFLCSLIFGVVQHGQAMADLQQTTDVINTILKPFNNAAEICEFQLQYTNKTHLHFNVTSRVLLGYYDCNRDKTGLYYACVANDTFINSCRYTTNRVVLPEEIIVKYKATVKKNNKEYAKHDFIYFITFVVMICSGTYVLHLIFKLRRLSNSE